MNEVRRQLEWSLVLMSTCISGLDRLTLSPCSP